MTRACLTISALAGPLCWGTDKAREVLEVIIDFTISYHCIEKS